MKVRAENNQTENRKARKNTIKSLFLEKVSKSAKPIVRIANK